MTRRASARAGGVRASERKRVLIVGASPWGGCGSEAEPPFAARGLLTQIDRHEAPPHGSGTHEPGCTCMSFGQSLPAAP